MLDRLKSLFTRTPDAPHGKQPDPLHVAACALLLEMAHADQEFTDDERQHIEALITRHFDLDEESTRQLMAFAEEARRRSIDLHEFTAVITDSYDEGQRLLLAELLWRVVYADGKLSEHEAYLARKLANLLDLRPGYLAEARHRALGESSRERS